jgi:hypothetical protein
MTSLERSLNWALDTILLGADACIKPRKKRETDPEENVMDLLPVLLYLPVGLVFLFIGVLARLQWEVIGRRARRMPD